MQIRYILHVSIAAHCHQIEFGNNFDLLNVILAWYVVDLPQLIHLNDFADMRFEILAIKSEQDNLVTDLFSVCDLAFDLFQR